MILIILGVLVMLYSFVNFKRAFIWFIGYQIFVAFGIQLVKIGGISVPLGLLISMVFLAEFVQKKRYKDSRMKDFPFKLAFILIIIARIMTCFTAVGSFGEELNRGITFIFQNIINVYIAWYVFQEEREYRRLFRMITVIMFITCIYGYYEYAISYNPYLHYEQTYLGEGINYYIIGVRGYRVTSFFEHPIGCGLNMGLYAIAALYLNINYGKRVPYRQLSVITSFLCIPIIILTKQRSAYIFLVVTALILINVNNKRFYRILFTAILGGLCILPLLQNYSNLFSSLFNSNTQSEVAGSTLAMRLSQLEACLNLLKESPLFGLGEKYGNYLTNMWTKQALMLESVWFDQMVKHGILGLLSYLVLAVQTIIGLFKKYSMSNTIFLPIAFWVVYSVTTIPAFKLPLYYIFIFFILKTKGKRNMAVKAELK